MRRPLLAEGRLQTVEVPAEGAARRIEVRPGRTSGGFRRGRLGRAGGAEISGGSAWLRVGPDRPGGVGEAASCVCSPGRPEFAGPGVSEDLAGLPRRLGTKGWKGQQTGCALSSSGPPAPTSTPPPTHTHTRSLALWALSDGGPHSLSQVRLDTCWAREAGPLGPACLHYSALSRTWALGLPIWGLSV